MIFPNSLYLEIFVFICSVLCVSQIRDTGLLFHYSINLLDLDSYSGTDPLGMFLLFLKRSAEVLAPCLAVVFRRLLRLLSFPVCWRQACLLEAG